jgi:hypothetical protein
MIKFIKRFAKRKYVQWLSWNRNLGKEPQKISETEKMCMSITRMMITHQDSKFLMAPLSGKRYITNKQLDIFIILDRGSISITNHIYHYDVVTNDRNWERLIKMYDGKVETIRQEYEDQIMSQITHSLHKIQDKIKIISTKN